MVVNKINHILHKSCCGRVDVGLLCWASAYRQRRYTKNKWINNFMFCLIHRLVKINVLLLILVTLNLSYSQSVNVPLTKLSTLDDDAVHVVILTDEPIEKLILPEGIPNKKYLNLFYSWESENDENISILLSQNDSCDILYVDLNNDENLINDGAPLVFPLSENNLLFDIIDTNDKNQKTRLVLSRTPDITDSLKNIYVDSEGNLLPKTAKQIDMINGSMGFTGRNRSFYFDDRMGVRRGELKIDNSKIAIGIFDYSNNGVFTDEKDVLFLDLDSNNRLGYENSSEIFKLNDIIEIKGKRYKFSYPDKYGLNITVHETEEEPTNYYSLMNSIDQKNDIHYELNQEFWQNRFLDINGKIITLADYRGKYLLLNFWGSWCQPCRTEIPDLANSLIKFNAKIEFISFIKTVNVENEKEFIKENRINWTQVEMPKTIEENFRISGYPTNLLIFPDGKTFIKRGVITEEFFKKYIR